MYMPNFRRNIDSFSTLSTLTVVTKMRYDYHFELTLFMIIAKYLDKI